LRVLAFDTSGPALSAAAAESGGRGVLAWRREELARGHAERLLPMLREVLAGVGWGWADVGLVAVTRGPGSFTGLRAGVAVARALGLSLGCPVLGLGTLEVVAHAAAGAGRPLLAVLDARRGEVYAQRFAADGSAEGPPELLPAGTVAEASGVEVADRAPDARDLAALALARLADGAARPGPGAGLRPLYVRQPDARPGAGASLLPPPATAVGG
jgi:tRNA threonylcarbamoyladenosine biosynthesis protein TsaB